MPMSDYLVSNLRINISETLVIKLSMPVLFGVLFRADGPSWPCLRSHQSSRKQLLSALFMRFTFHS